MYHAAQPWSARKLEIQSKQIKRCRWYSTESPPIMASIKLVVASTLFLLPTTSHSFAAPPAKLGRPAGKGLLMSESPEDIAEAASDSSMSKKPTKAGGSMFGSLLGGLKPKPNADLGPSPLDMLREAFSPPAPISSNIDRPLPPLSEEVAAALAGMEPAEAADFALAAGQKFYRYQQVGGFMRQQLKAQQCLKQAELSIPMLRALAGSDAAGGFDDDVLQQARDMADDIEKERSIALADAAKKGIEL